MQTAELEYHICCDDHIIASVKKAMLYCFMQFISSTYEILLVGYSEK